MTTVQVEARVGTHEVQVTSTAALGPRGPKGDPGEPGVGVDLTDELNQEIADRQAGDASLLADLADEITSREAGDSALDARLDTVESTLPNKADLVAGKVPTAQLPAIATVERRLVANQAARLALTDVQPGDVAVQADLAETFLLIDNDPSQASSWKAIDHTAVASVNGQVGTVILGKSDVGLGNVDNTSDTGKPVSTAQQAALDLKAPLASPALTGNPTAPTQSPGNSSTRLATTAFVGDAIATQHTADTGTFVPADLSTLTASTSPDSDDEIVVWLDGALRRVPLSNVLALGGGGGTVDVVSNVAQDRILGRVTAGSGDSEELTAAQVKTLLALVKGDVGLGNVDNTSDANKPVSTATQTALDLKANAANPTFTGTVTIPDGALAIADTSGLQAALDAKVPLDLSTLTVSTAPDSDDLVYVWLDGAARKVALSDLIALVLASPTLTGTVTVPDGALAIADTSGLQAALDAKAPSANPTFTGTVTIPDGALAIADTSGLQAALDAKAALSGATFTGAVREAVVALTDGANIATDASLGNVFKVTLGGNRTMDNPTNPVAGQKIIYRLVQDATGSRTITWGSAFRFSTDVPSPTLTTTAAKADYIGFIYNSDAAKWDCLAVNKGF